MATIRTTLVTSLDAATATRFEKHPDGRQALNSMSNFLVAFASGARGRSAGSAVSYSVEVDDNATAASGTVTTTASVANNSTVTIGSTVLTGVTGTPSGQAQFKCGVSANADATALAACINAHTTLSQFVSAVAASAVVTITCLGTVTPAVLGNAITLKSSDGTNLAVSGANLASGANDANAVTYTF
jgi:hypothetical protein